MSFKIIVDSCCDLTPAQLREECFVKVPLTIRVGNHTIVDDDTFDQGELLWRMKESETAPQSACPSPMQYLEAFDCGADDLYVVTLSALLSGSHNAAAQARSIWLEDHPGANIHIFNSCSASAGEVLVALKLQELAEAVSGEVDQFLTVLSRAEIIRKSLDNYGYILVADTMDEAVEIANEIASEHLEIQTKDPYDVMTRIRNAGAIFIGEYSSEPLGDYFAGPNHVLPTNGTAKFFSPLSVDDFIKKSSIIAYSREALEAIHTDIEAFAKAEQLTAHANSIHVRFEE